MERDSLLSIQILRAVAALAVCAVHFDQMTLMLAGRPNDPIPLYPLAAGVDLFFVISGFVMVYSSEQLFGRSGSPKEFLIRRLARIVPLYWLTMAIGIWAESTPFDLRTLLKSYLFIPYASPSGNISPLYGVGWTLNFEMFFYIIFAGAIFLRRGKAVTCIAATLLLLVTAGRIFHPTISAFIFWTDPIVLEFMMGMILALIFRYGIRVPAWLGGALIVAGAIAIWHGVTYMPPSTDRWLRCGVPAAMILAGIVLQPPLKSPLRFVHMLGDASYSMYLLHSLFIAAIFRLWQVGLNRVPMQDAVIVGFLMTIAVSLLTYRYIERPLTRWLRGIGTSISLAAIQRLFALPPETDNLETVDGIGDWGGADHK